MSHLKRASNRRADLRQTGDLPIVKRRSRYCNAPHHPPVEGDNLMQRVKNGKVYEECRTCNREKVKRHRLRM